MKLSCIIVDDEPLALEVLKTHISNFSALNLLAVHNTAIDALNFLHTQTPDLIFLDIEMPKMNGITFLESLKNLPLIIFTTAHREYAVEGFDFNIIDFLLKPISFNRLAKAVNKAIEFKRIQLSGTKTEQGKDVNENKIFIRSGTRIVSLIVTDIVFIEAMKDYIKIYTNKNERLVVKKTMKDFEGVFSGQYFLRVHKSFTVAVSYIRSLSRGVIEVGEYQIPVGRNYLKFVTAFLKNDIQQDD